MPTLRFYQTQGTTPAEVDAVLPPLLQKMLAGGHQVLLVCPSSARQTRLDEALWIFSAGSFLPHACVQAKLPGPQPVLLALEADALAHATGTVPLVLGGAESVLPALTECTPLTCYVFGTQAAEVARARQSWQQAPATWDKEYWQQTEKGWHQKQLARPTSMA
jgi:DNA polymerase-3 subunit chi